MELAADGVQWWALVLAMLNLQVLLPGGQLISEMNLRKMVMRIAGWRVDKTGLGLCLIAGFGY
jgi:hypothetical protein